MDNNELMNRRRFFKKTAKEMLPMLGAFVAAPTVIMSTLTSCCCVGCEADCKDNCVDSCLSYCSDSCSISSSGGCSDCSSSCSGSSTSTTCSSCANDCSTSCSDSSTSTACSSCANDCSSSCKENCKESCKDSCKESCKDSCKESCKESCKDSCKESCKNTCSTSCEGSATGKTFISDADGSVDGHEFVDLGLSVNWARCNLGATQPWGAGSYNSFADPQGDVYNSSSIEEYYGEKEYSNFYNNYRKTDSSISGTRYDTATYKWGSKWKMPTKSQFDELLDNCNIEYCKYEERDEVGIKLTSKINGKSIFLPAAGVKFILFSSNFELHGKNESGCYWTATSRYFGSSLGQAYEFRFSYAEQHNEFDGYIDWEQKNTIRPITTNSGGGNNGCTGSSCSSNCANNTTNGSCSNCSSNCSSGCKESCSGNCADSCKTGCGGSCNTSCGGGCTYLSRGSSCSGCATTCYNQCYTACTLACADNCQSSCVYGSK